MKDGTECCFNPVYRGVAAGSSCWRELGLSFLIEAVATKGYSTAILFKAIANELRCLSRLADVSLAALASSVLYSRRSGLYRSTVPYIRWKARANVITAPRELKADISSRSPSIRLAQAEACVFSLKVLDLRVRPSFLMVALYVPAGVLVIEAMVNLAKNKHKIRTGL